jgi:glutamate/tyrosine decarboxylase-like PLP-dependent enzyme
VDAPYLVRHPRREPSNLRPELSRRVRAIEVWAALKFLGRNGLENLIDQCCRQTTDEDVERSIRAIASALVK